MNKGWVGGEATGSPPCRNERSGLKTEGFEEVLSEVEGRRSITCTLRQYGIIVRMKEKMNSNKKIARIAGVFYLLVGIFGGFAEGYVDPKMYAASDAAATAQNILANPGLVRLSVVAHLLDGVFFIFTVLTLYILLQHVHKSVAKTMVILVALAVGIICLNAVFQFEALRVVTGAVNLSALGTAGSNALVLLLLDMQHYGTLIAQVFFGLWLVPLGYLAYKSEMFPKWLSILLIVGGVGYLVDLLAAFLAPDIGQKIHTFVVVIPATIAEVSMVLYLLTIGVKTTKPSEPIFEGR